MGHPKKQRRKYEGPKRPFDKQRIERERKILNDYGLRRKREIWKSEGILRDFRTRARELLAAIAAVLGLEGTGYGFELEEGR